MKFGRDEVLVARICVEAFYQIHPGVDLRQAKKSKRASKTKGFTWNAAILVVFSARYSKGWIQGGAKIPYNGYFLRLSNFCGILRVYRNRRN